MSEETTDVTTPVVTIADLETKMAEASAAKDWKTVRQVARDLDAAESAIAKTKREALQAAIAGLTEKVKATIDKAIAKMIEAGELDGADGVWYSKDFGDESSGCRLLKTAKKPAGETAAGNGGSYVSRPEKSTELLKTVGHMPFITGGQLVTKRTIDKTEHSFPEGLSLQQAWEYSTNGGWRNVVRQALLKAAGLI